MALHGVLFTLRWRRIVRLSSVISLTRAPVTCRKRFVRGAKAPRSRQFAEGIGWRWGRLLLQPLPFLSCISWFPYTYVIQVTTVSTGDVNHPPLLFSTSIVSWNLLISGLTWLDSLSVCRNYLVTRNCLCCRCQLLPWKGEACTMSGRASPKNLH